MTEHATRIREEKVQSHTIKADYHFSKISQWKQNLSHSNDMAGQSKISTFQWWDNHDKITQHPKTTPAEDRICHLPKISQWRKMKSITISQWNSTKSISQWIKRKRQTCSEGNCQKVSASLVPGSRFIHFRTEPFFQKGSQQEVTMMSPFKKKWWKSYQVYIFPLKQNLSPSKN